MCNSRRGRLIFLVGLLDDLFAQTLQKFAVQFLARTGGAGGAANPLRSLPSTRTLAGGTSYPFLARVLYERFNLIDVWMVWQPGRVVCYVDSSVGRSDE